LSVCLLASVALLLAHEAQCAPKRVPMSQYTIDLDQPPEKRWIPLLKDFKSSAPLIVDYFNNGVSFIVYLTLSNGSPWSQAPPMVAGLLKTLMADLDGYLGELGVEMKTIAEYLEIDLGVIVSLNFAYELRRVSSLYCNVIMY